MHCEIRLVLVAAFTNLLLVPLPGTVGGGLLRLRVAFRVLRHKMLRGFASEFAREDALVPRGLSSPWPPNRA